MRKNFIPLGINLVLLVGTWQVSAGEEMPPWILGRAKGRFEVGELVMQDDFLNLNQWVVQVQEREGFPEAKVEVNEGTLDCLVPGRGCTVWFKEKLQTRVSISYEVVCPEPEVGMRGVQVKDVNHFWLASDPIDSEKGLFDRARYTGDFGDYHKMNSYYASSGGRRNTTTRLRRYPRAKGGEFIEHIALKERDEVAEYLLTPGKRMKVQLVAFDDLVQYLVDGELVYEIAFGDIVAVEQVQGGKKVEGSKPYNKEEFPFYREGFFGFRMVGTHHIYSKFRVHELKPAQ